MAHYDDRLRGIKNVSFEEALANVKDDLRRQLVHIYFKAEPDFVKIIEDDEAYDKIFAEVLDCDGFREAYAVHCRRRSVVRFVGQLYKFSESFSPRVAHRVAIEMAVKHISLYLKRSDEFTLTNLQRLKFYNKALKMEMTMLQEDLEWNDDLNDDMFNEIQRFERNVERERLENVKLLLKSKSRKGEIELLQYRLINEFGIEPARKDKPKKTKGKKSSSKAKPKHCENNDDDSEKDGDDEDDASEKAGSIKNAAKRGFTSVAKD